MPLSWERLIKRVSGCGFFVFLAGFGDRVIRDNREHANMTIKTTKHGRGPQPPVTSESRRGHRRAARRGRHTISLGVHVAQAAGPEVTKATLGFIALSDAGSLFVAKDKGFFAKHGMPDVEVAKQASWGATRDNLVLGLRRQRIDGAHILTPMPYLISAGKVTQNNVPTPMYILARLNLDAQAISVAKEYADLKLGVDSAPFKRRSRRRKLPARP